MKIIKTHDELIKLHGRKVTCDITGVKITDAKISVTDNDRVYICHNNEYRDGEPTENKLDYKYSWFISDSVDKYENGISDYTIIQLADNYIYGDTSHWPEWFDGRPIKGYVSDISVEDAISAKRVEECICVAKGKAPYVCLMPDNLSPIGWEYFVPLEEPEVKSVTIIIDGKPAEVTLTAEQEEKLRGWIGEIST